MPGKWSWLLARPLFSSGWAWAASGDDVLRAATGRAVPSTYVLFKPLLPSRLLMPHRPTQVTWPRPKSVWEGAAPGCVYKETQFVGAGYCSSATTTLNQGLECPQSSSLYHVFAFLLQVIFIPSDKCFPQLQGSLSQLPTPKSLFPFNSILRVTGKHSAWSIEGQKPILSLSSRQAVAGSSH